MSTNHDIPMIRSRKPSARLPLPVLLVLLALVCALAFGAGLQAVEKEKPYHRITVGPQAGASLPYTIEVPEGWQIVQAKEVPGLFLGPPGAIPPNDPSLIYVRGSQVSLANPAQVAQSIRENDEKQPTWTAPRIEVKDLGGVKGLLVRMDSGEGEKARSTLVLKLPLGDKGVDFLCQAPRAQFDKNLPMYERLLLSVRPAPGSPEVKPK
jgi:hypothetical protein